MLEQGIMLHCVPMNISVLCSQICLDVMGFVFVFTSSPLPLN